MTGAELYKKLVETADMSVDQKESLIEVLQDALDAAWEAGRDAADER